MEYTASQTSLVRDVLKPNPVLAEATHRRYCPFTRKNFRIVQKRDLGREMTLLDTGWTEEQAQGLLDSLKLNGGMSEPKPEHLQRLRDRSSTLAFSTRP